MSPSVSEKRNVGKRHQKSAHMRSPSVYTLMVDESVIGTLAGASLVVDDAFDDDPTWQQSTVPASSARGEQRVPVVPSGSTACSGLPGSR